jgi:hypothetical protein
MAIKIGRRRKKKRPETDNPADAQPGATVATASKIQIARTESHSWMKKGSPLLRTANQLNVKVRWFYKLYPL